MDHVVHIDNGGRESRPIIIRLLPGEETIFNLKVVNHGEPSNITLQASSPVFKAVRLKKPDHYVTEEEVIPILARMPMDRRRLDGEIAISGGGRKSLVPITLLRDSEDQRSDLEDSGVLDQDDLDLGTGAAEQEEGGQGASGGEDEEGQDDSEDYENRDDKAGRARERETRSITFSREDDLQMYRSARRRRMEEGASGISEEGGGHRGRGDDGFVPRYNTRIDDRFVGKNSRADDPSSAEEVTEERVDGKDGEEEWQSPHTSDDDDNDYDDDDVWPGYRQEADNESREIIQQGEKEEMIPLSEEEDEERDGADEFDGESQADGRGYGGEYGEEDERVPHTPGYDLFGKTGGFPGFGSIQAVPSVIFLTLITVLILTFFTESIPEFPGALASSILIVTLIIYGAAKLIKA